MNRLIILAILFLSACVPEYPSIPSDVLPMKEMVQIMADIHVTDAVAAEKAQGGMSEQELTQQYMERVYKNRKVTREEFIRSYHFYETHPVLLFDKMYEEILVEMSGRESHIKP